MTEEQNERATAVAESSADAAGGGTAPGGPKRRRRSRGRGRGRPSQAAGASAAAGSSSQAGEPAAPEPASQPEPTRKVTSAAGTKPSAGAKTEGAEGDGESGGATAPRKRRRRRGGRGRSRPKAAAGADEATAQDTAEQAEKPPTRGAARAKAAGDKIVAAATEAFGEPAAGGSASTGSSKVAPEEGQPARRPRRRPTRATVEAEPETPAPSEPPAAKPRTRRRSGSSGRGQTATEAAPASGQATGVAEPQAEPSAAESGRPTRTRRSRLPGRRRREPTAPIRREGDKIMLVTQHGERDQIAVLENRTLVEHYITRSGAKSMVGNIYLGKVQNVLPGMEAAFIDVGRGRNAVLYAGEVSYDEEIDGETPRIEHVLKSGQNVLVQVTKDPMGGKGARLTQEISLPGRYLVLVPNSQVFGISRRLPDKERQRLKELLKQVRPPEHGVIVRTAAEGASEEDLKADLERLTAEWAVIDKSRKRGKSPRPLYEEPELTVRVVRDMFNEGEFSEIVTDSAELFDRVTAYLQSVAPDLVSKVHMHTGPLPVLEAYHALEQIHKALDRKVWLPSGGYIVVDKTEAMTVIDVNTGKHVGKANLEETVTKTNTEAAEEIARQLRLRDIGGIIIIDFIDMAFERNKQRVIDTLKNALAQDKTRSQVFDIGPLGLLEVTRKRVSAGLLESFSETCPTCEGRGIILTHKL